MCLRKNTDPRNLSKGQQGTLGAIPGEPDTGLWVSNLVKASCDKRVGIDAAQERWGKILDGGLITEGKNIMNV